MSRIRLIPLKQHHENIDLDVRNRAWRTLLTDGRRYDEMQALWNRHQRFKPWYAFIPWCKWAREERLLNHTIGDLDMRLTHAEQIMRNITLSKN